MGSHPSRRRQQQDRVRAEARAVLGGRLDGDGAPLGLADVQKLEYTQAVVKETLRTGACVGACEGCVFRDVMRGTRLVLNLFFLKPDIPPLPPFFRTSNPQ